MWSVINTYLSFRREGMTRRAAAAKVYRILDDLLTLLVALRIYEQSVRDRRAKRGVQPDEHNNEG